MKFMVFRVFKIFKSEKMKKNIILLLTLFFISIGFAKTTKGNYIPFNCDIKVNIKDHKIPNGSIFYLRKNFSDDHSWPIIDSCTLKNNKLIFNTRLKEPLIGYLSLKNNDTIFSPDFVISNKPINIEWIKKNPVSVIINGGERQFIEQYARSFNILEYNRDIQFDISSQISKYGVVQSKNPNYEYWINYQKQFYKWVTNNPKKYYTLIKLYYNRGDLSEKTIVNCLESLKAAYSNTTIYSILSKYIKSRKASLLEGKLINIDLIDNKHKNIKSTDVFLANKDFYVVDFGASWCGYCILEARELNKKYESIDTTKIQIISISVDKEINDWLKFEKRENYKWKSYVVNVKLDQGHTQSILSWFPTYFVLDKNKKIIGKYNSLDAIPILKLK